MTITNHCQRNFRKTSWPFVYTDKTNDGWISELESVNLKYSQSLPILQNCGDFPFSNEEKPYNADGDNSLYKTLTCQSRFTTESNAYHTLPPDLRDLVEAVDYGLPDTYEVSTDDKPKWLETEKFKLGQRFAMKYIIGLTFCELASLLVCSLVQDNLKTMIYSGNSSSPLTSYKRFLSTVLRINSWFEDDIWDRNSSGHKNLVAVRAMHLNMSRKINSESEKSLKVKLRNEDAMLCPLFEDLREDFRPLCPVFDCSPDCFRIPKLHFSQCDMSLTQFGFFGLMVLYPEKFGAGNASKEELDGLVHVWRVLGYYLGIDDRFNFCQGSLDEVRERCKNVIDYWFRPSFSNVTQEWEHMARCLTEGVSYYVHGVSFEVLLLYLCWVLDIHAPRLYSSLTWRQHILFNITRLVMCVLLRIPGVLALFNLFLYQSLDIAQNRMPGKLKLLENKAYSFQSRKRLLFY